MRRAVITLLAGATLATGGIASATSHPVGSCTSVTYAATYHPAYTTPAHTTATGRRYAAVYHQSYTIEPHTKRTCYGS